MRNTTLFKSSNNVRGQMLLLMCMSLTTAEFYGAPLAETTAKAYFQATVKGTITSAGDNLPIPGVTVMIKGTNVAVSTDIDGNFEIPAAAPDAVLVISSIGFKTQEIPVNGQTSINVILQEDNKELDEVVVVGYGVKKKATVTGSISEISGKEIVKTPAVNVSNSFSGRVSGVIANNRGGEPGYDDSAITIRGISTMNSNDVLVVVDGIPGQIGGLNRLNPQEIESITVLKDASAAIYGARAANGVILVTTKKGKRGSKMQVSYNFDQGLSSPTRLPDMADAATYAQIRNEIASYNGQTPVYTQDQIQMFRDGSDPLNYPNTDWAKVALRKSSLQTQHNLNVQGGSENANYFFSLGKLSQEGIYRNGVTNYDQYNVRTNIDANVNDRLKVGVSLSGRKEDRIYPITGGGEIFRTIYRAFPTVPAYYPNGLPSLGIERSNPAILPTGLGGTNENPTYIFNGILRGSYDFAFLEGLSVDGFYSADISQSSSKSFATPYNLYNYENGNYVANLVGGGADQQGELNESQNNISQTVANIKLNFKRRFDVHNIDAFVGYEQSEYERHEFTAMRRHFPTTLTPELSQGGAAATDRDNSGLTERYNRQSVISRIAYDYDEKYLLDLQMRVDGSSNFPSGSRYGFFPSVSAGYRISKEDWFADKVTFFDDLKIRASWGQLGNDNTRAFQFYDNYTFNNRYVVGNTLQSGIDLRKIANYGITWERANKIDVGINARFLKNFTFEAVYFTQDRDKILIARNASIPGSTGIVNPHNEDPLVPSENIGRMKSHGIETTLGYSHEGEFSWGVSGNFTFAKSKVVNNDEAPGTPDYQRLTGNPWGTYLLYDAIGIYQTKEQIDATPNLGEAVQPGDLIYRDVNGDGRITDLDRVRSKYGNIPQMTFGLSADARYKNFDISVLFSGQAQVSQYVLPESGTIGNFYSSWADNRWSPTNTNGSYPRVSERSGTAVSGGGFRNNFWLNDASFVRLKNVQLGYTLPSDILEGYGISSFRVYASAFNLFTITKVKDYDPEGSSESGQFYPQQKIINLGFNVQF